MKIGIIGMGFVGGTTAKVLEEAHEIIPYDKYKKEYRNPIKLAEAEVVFVCVPTPAKPNGDIDLSIIHDSIQILSKVTKETKPLVVIRSTTVPGTADKLGEEYPFNFASNPEFLREKHALEDMKKTKRIIIGANNDSDYEKILMVYKPIFPHAKYINVDRKTAEMIKYISNIMLIGQIALANEIYQICKALNVDYDFVKNALLMDDRIARNISVPGPDGDLGFGGKCFPKDLRALMYLSKEKGYNPQLFEEVWRLNERIRKNKDWLKIPGTTSKNKNFKDK